MPSATTGTPFRFFAALLLSAPLGAQSYTIEDLGSVAPNPSDGVRAVSINNRGHVHGEFDKTTTQGLQWRAFFWDGTQQTKIRPPVSGSDWSGALNDSDRCVGYYSESALRLSAYEWSSGVFTTVALGQHDFTRSFDISADGHTAGTYTSDVLVDLRYRYHAFLRAPSGSWLDLGTLGGSESFGRALNDFGHVVGTSKDAADLTQAFLWTPLGGMVSLVGLGGRFASPFDIDNFDRIVGVAEDSTGRTRPVMWENGQIRDLGSLGGGSDTPFGLNDFGDVVGTSVDPAGKSHAVLWAGGTAPQMLDPLIPPGSNWELSQARSINELGEICGYGLHNGLPRAFRLTPKLAAARLSGLQPGIAGRESALFGIAFTPGAMVDLYLGLQPGSTTLPCGAVLGIAQARHFASVVADAGGRVEVHGWVPARMAGRQLLLQAVESATCTVGELRWQRLP